MVVEQGEVWWADLPEPAGTEAGFRRPVVVIQADFLNRSRLGTVLCVPLTTNLNWSDAPGNVVLPARITGLKKDSVAQAVHVIAIDRQLLANRAGRISRQHLQAIFTGIDIVLGR